MRGAKKTTEDASNLRNAEALFENHTVVEIREVEANTRKDIEEKKEDLRQLVGASYRDLIESADSIVYMRNSCENVAANTRKMEDGFQFLKDRISGTTAAPEVDEEKKRRERLYGIGSRVKYIVDTPEKIWGCLDEHMYLEGAQRYFRAREVQTLLVETEIKGEKKELLSHFPLLRDQSSLVETFRGQISQRSRDRLLEPGLDVVQYAVALAAVAVIDDLSPSQIFSFFFETRRAWLRAHLRTARDRARKNKAMDVMDGKPALPVKETQSELEQPQEAKKSSSVDATAMVFSRAANIIQGSLCQAGQLFLEVNGDAPLFFSTVLSSPPGAQLFGGIPNPEDEARLWKLHWEKLEARTSSLSGQFISETCRSWIHTCGEDLSVEGKLLLDLVVQVKDLERIEQSIRTQSDSQEVLAQSMSWLESAFGQSIDSPWDYLTSLLLKEPLNLWNALFESIFMERAKEIIDFGLAKINVAKTLDEFLAITSSPSSDLQDGLDLSLQVLGLRSTNLRWFAGVQREARVRELSETLVGGSDKMQDEELFGISNSYLGPEVSQIKQAIDMSLSTLLEDCVSFIQAQHNHTRSQELAFYLEKHCFEWMSNTLNVLQSKLMNLSDGIGQCVGKTGKSLNLSKSSSDNCDEVGSNRRSITVTEVDAVEKALFLGRTFVALSDHSWALPAILHHSKSWSPQMASSAGSTLARMTSLHPRNFWSDVMESSSQGRQLVKSADTWRGDHDNMQFGRLQLALRYSSLVAHGMWVSWSVEGLTTLLARDLLEDDDLASSVPLKGWEETLLRQRNEQGDEIEVRLPLPAMPSPYVISFLFKSCQEIYRIGGHALDKLILQMFAWRLLEKVLTIYEDFISELKVAKHRVSEKGLLQTLFDLRFLGDVLSGGQHLSSDLYLKDEQILESIFSSSNLARIRQLMFQTDANLQERKQWHVSLQEKLSNFLDPIDWATYEPHLWENEKQSYQRCAVLFGFFVQLNHLFRDTTQRLPLNSESNTLKVSATVPRFTYLPISTLSLSKKSSNDESVVTWKSSKLMFEDDSSFASVVGARPLLRSLMNQVGTKFGEGTFKLGSMLTDGQVSRLKDRSAAAISTFGDILPAQAAGLFSSFTAGVTKAETSYY